MDIIVTKDKLLYFRSKIKSAYAKLVHSHVVADIKDFPALKTVATSGSYTDLTNKPTVDNTLSNTSTNAIQNSVVYTALSGKQASLSQTQLNACNSGITSTKVSTYDGYATTIASKANARDVYTKTEIDNKLTSAMRYKGSVATFSALPTTNLTVGDMYNVIATGANYVWDGEKWDETGMVIDLSPYAKTSDFREITNEEIDAMFID